MFVYLFQISIMRGKNFQLEKIWVNKIIKHENFVKKLNRVLDIYAFLIETYLPLSE